VAPPQSTVEQGSSAAGESSVLARSWRLGSQVAVRPEPFGALLYHFGTRRLSFLKSRMLCDVVESLDRHACAADACRAAGVVDGEMRSFERALAALAASGMICGRDGPG
jgi:putative mycofactocin binding protein MftB